MEEKYNASRVLTLADVTLWITRIIVGLTIPGVFTALLRIHTQQAVSLQTAIETKEILKEIRSDVKDHESRIVAIEHGCCKR